MAITYRDDRAVVTSAGATTLALQTPQKCKTGDIMLMGITVNTAVAQTFTGLTGWTTFKNINVNAPVLTVLYKVADATDAAGTTYNPSWGTPAACAGWIGAWSGVDVVLGPADTTASSNNTASTTINYGNVTAYVNDMIVSFGAIASASTPGTPSGFTNHRNNSTNLGLNISESSVFSGPTGAITSTASGSANSQGVLIALRPSQLPSFRAAGTGATGATSVSPSQPASTQIGDTLIAICSSTSSTTTWTGPGGSWTQVGSTQNGQAVFYLLSATAAGSGTSHTFTCSSGTNSAKIIAYTGVGSISDSASTANTAVATASWVFPSVTPSSADSVLVCIGSITTNLSGTPDAGMVEQLDAAISTAHQYIQDEGSLTSGVATGTRGLTWSSSPLTGIGASIILAAPSNCPKLRGVDKNAVTATTSMSQQFADCGAQSGDLIIMTVNWTTTPGTVTPPSGWIEIESDMVSAQWFKAWRKIYDGVESDPSITWTTSATAGGLMAAIANGGQVNIHLHDHTLVASSTTMTFPSLSLTSSPALLLFHGHDDASTTMTTTPAGIVTVQNVSSTAGRWYGYEMASGANSTGSRTGTWGLSGANTGFIAAIVNSPTSGGPIADESVGTWFTAPLYPNLDETVADDADYISSAGGTCTLDLAPIADPGAGSVTISYRYRTRVDTKTLTVTLKQGSTTIATWTHSNIAPGSFVQADQTLTSPQKASVTDWTSLSIDLAAS